MPTERDGLLPVLAGRHCIVGKPTELDGSIRSGRQLHTASTPEAIVVKVTQYFDAIRTRPDRAAIQDAWIERAVHEPIREALQPDSRIRRWTRIPQADGRYLRVVLLEDGETVHNAFFDRGFVP